MSRQVSTKAPTQDLSAMYAEAKKVGAKGITWAGIAGKGQVLVAQKADGTYSAFDKSGHEQKLGAAASPEAAHDIAVAAMQSGKSTLSDLASLDMAGLSQATREKLNSANGSNIQPSGGNTPEAGDTGQVLNPTDGTEKNSQTTPAPTVESNPTNKRVANSGEQANSSQLQDVTEEEFNRTFNNKVTTANTRGIGSHNDKGAAIVKDPYIAGKYYTIDKNNKVKAFTASSDSDATAKVNSYIKDGIIEGRDFNNKNQSNQTQSSQENANQPAANTGSSEYNPVLSE